MDAIAPATAASPVPAARTAPQSAPEQVVAAAPPSPASAPALPALPAAVQRAQLEPAPATLMTLEDMTALLGLL
jgi:hypothetical protein